MVLGLKNNWNRPFAFTASDGSTIRLTSVGSDGSEVKIDSSLMSKSIERARINGFITVTEETIAPVDKTAEDKVSE